MPLITIKSAAQLDLQAIHRQRECLVRQRTQLINQIKAFLLDPGVYVAHQPLTDIERRKSARLAAKKVAPSPPIKSNCGQTASRPAPRNATALANARK